MDIDYNRPSEQILLDLLFYTSGSAIPEGSLVFGTPTTFGPFQNDPFQRDTRVRVSVASSPSARMRGTVTLQYARLWLDDFIPEFEQIPIEVATLPFTTYQILPMLNARYGLQLAEADVENDTFEVAAPTYAIRAKPSSLVWQGTLPIETTYDEIRLDALILVTELNGFWPLDGMDLNENFNVAALNGFEAA